MRSRTFASFLLLLVSCTIAALSGQLTATFAAEPAAPTGPPALKVVGIKLKTADGTVVRLQGVNIACLEWRADGENVLKSVGVAIDDWGANAIRLPLSQDRWFGKAKEQTDDGAAYRKLVKEIVDTVAAKKCYIILDLHWSNGGVWGQNIGQHRMPDDNSLKFWEEVAPIYANHPAVLFGLYNEPHSVSWEIWRDGGDITGDGPKYHSPGMQKLINAIRDKKANNIIVVGGLEWAYDLSGIVKGFALTDAKGNGILYDTHVYPFKTRLDQVVTPVVEKHAVLMGECGYAPYGRYENPKNFPQTILEYIDKHQLSWTAWDFHPAADPCLIKDWSYTPTDYWGVPVKKALQKAAKEREAAKGKK